MKILENILDYITDKSKRLSTRASVVILVLFTLFLFDNYIGFSFYYNSQRQLDQLTTVTQLLKDSTITTETRQKLTELEKHTFDRKTIIDYTLSFTHSMYQNGSQAIISSTTNNEFPKRNNILFLMSTSGMYFLLLIILIPVLFITNRETPFLKLFAAIILFAFIMLFCAWLNYWLFGKLISNPIGGSWTLNYIINILIQIAMGIPLYLTTKLMESKASRR